MSILKTYVAQIDYPDGSIEHVQTKARRIQDVLPQLEEQYPDASWIADPVRLDKGRRESKSLWRSEPIFRHKLSRGGRYIYRHKGKKLKGKPNYPNRYWWPVVMKTGTFCVDDGWSLCCVDKVYLYCNTNRFDVKKAVNPLQE